MLEAQEHRGYFVPQMGRDDMLEIYEVREAVDGIASRRAAQSERRALLVENLQDVLAEQARCVAAGDINTYRDLDVAFHLAIWRASGNRRLLSISDNLLGQVRIGNNISAQAPGRLPGSSAGAHLDPRGPAHRRRASRRARHPPTMFGKQRRTRRPARLNLLPHAGRRPLSARPGPGHRQPGGQVARSLPGTGVTTVGPRSCSTIRRSISRGHAHHRFQGHGRQLSARTAPRPRWLLLPAPG